MSISEKLDKLPRTGTGGKGKKAGFTVEEWREIHSAHRDGVRLSDIYLSVGKEKYSSLGSFQSSLFDARRKLGLS